MPSRPRRIRRELCDALADAHDLDAVFLAADAVVRPAIGASGGAWSTVDPATMLGTSCRVLVDLGDGPVQLAHDPVRERANFEVEWEDAEPNTFHAMVRDGRVSSLLRHDVGDLGAVGRVRRIMEPLGASDEARLLVADRGTVWGTALFYRMDGGAFDASAAEVLTACAPVLATAVRRVLLASAVDRPGLPSPPGSLLLGGDDAVLVTSPAAEELLGLLGEHHARTALASLAAATRRRGATSTRVLGDGEVVVLHAEPAKGLAGAVAVVVERPRPIELAPLIVESLGLTDRQRQVAEGLLAGASRAVIARRLGITEHTVAETASAVFRRAGVASRSELCALLFADYYAEPFHAGAAPSPFGYFLPAVGHARLRS